MPSVPWSNETERADYYKKLYNEQLAICDMLEKEIEMLRAEKKLLKSNISMNRKIIEAKAESI